MKNYIKYTTTLLFMTLFVMGLLSASYAEVAQPIDPISKENTSARKTIFQELTVEGKIQKITLKTDLRKLIEDKKLDNYTKAKLSYTNVSGKSISQDIQLKPRGKFRRKTCDFPPLKLKFSKKKLVRSGLNQNFNKIKLVTHCISDKSDSKENVLKEFLAYQLMNELTNNSFKVQLVEVSYEDINDPSLNVKRYGFIIENKEEMAQRLGSEICDCYNPSQEDMDRQNFNLQAMFQFMIGNADWDVSVSRNLKMLKTDKGLRTVPYDFDFAGLVASDYAIPNVNYHLRKVTDRVFLGTFKDKEEMNQMISFFKTKKKVLLKTVNEQQAMSYFTKVEAKKYLQSFFSLLKDEQKCEEIFLEGNIYSIADI